MPCLAGILITIAYNMSEWRHFKQLLRSSREDVLVLLMTFGLTILVDLTIAIEVGVVLAALLFMHRMAEAAHVDLVDDNDNNGKPHEYAGVPDGVEIFELHGPFFFGAIDKFREALLSFRKSPKVIILRMSAVPAIDASAVRTLERLLKDTRRRGAYIVIAGVSHKVYRTFLKSGLLEKIGADNIHSDVPLALAQAIILLENG
jgi:SulP family sulfate permease